MTVMDAIAPAAAQLIDALDRARHIQEPFDYWLLDEILPLELVDRIAALPFAPPGGARFDGRREVNNSTRVYFSPETQERFSVCRKAVEAFGNQDVVRRIEQVTGTDLSRGRLRIEYCQDVDGFWLEPHVDIPVKLFTMLVYLSGDQNLYEAGTDIYDATPEHNRVATAPYERNKGLIFIPGIDTWHGFSKRHIAGVRKSIIINWVSPEWRATEELC